MMIRQRPTRMPFHGPKKPANSEVELQGSPSGRRSVLIMNRHNCGLLDAGRARKSGLIDKAMVDGVEGQFEAVGDAELIEDVVQVIFHRLFADEEFLSDFAVAEALSH